MKLSPIIIFAYNRPQHLERLVKSLLLNPEAKDSHLYIFADGAKQDSQQQVNTVRDIINQIEGFRCLTVTYRNQNIGLANNIIKGVSEVLDNYETAIVLEDDLIATPHLLKYMNEALDFYRDTQAFSIAGYTPKIELPKGYDSDTYAINRNCSWGWATWRNRWEKVDWQVSDFKDFISDNSRVDLFNQSGNDLTTMLLKQQTGVINSWSIRFCYTGFCLEMPTIYPTKSFIINGGADGSGSNMSATSKYETEIFGDIKKFNFCNNLTINPLILQSFRKTYDCSLIRRIINWWKRRKYTRK